ncbi:MAG: hypothetical protein AUG84_00785 [Chloroflexi bacterium 13_1_20CM_4_66_7]|nr:MAG: hypothetical protein AUG84_00785 [Chloroflexi bacterium 13_1_20CM_4_66_7]
MNIAVERLEAAMLELPQAECDVVHSFAPGLYIRQVTLPAGAVAVGHYQKTTHLNVMLKGRVTMIEPDGSHIERAAPLTYIAAAGRKVGYVHEEVIWLNIYATDERDVEKLEALFLDKSPAWQEAQKLIASDRAEDRADFEEMIASLGYTLALVREQSENLADLIDFPPGSYGVKVGRSSIEGRGLIATQAFEAGEVIAPARIGGMRTPAGRFTNHAKRPNAAMLGRANGDIDLVAIEDIAGCRGGADGDEITIDYRHALAVNQRLRGAA